MLQVVHLSRHFASASNERRQEPRHPVQVHLHQSVGSITTGRRKTSTIVSKVVTTKYKYISIDEVHIFCQINS
jgi:hypothetical protein